VSGPLVLSSFLAASIEVVEMVAIVVAVGAARSWRASLLGAGCGLLLLVATIGALGPALASIPLQPLRLVVGSLLLVFGLGWVRKGILLVSRDGWMAGGVGDAEVEGTRPRGGLDATAFVLSFKGVSLEGLEIAVVVIALGAGAGDLRPVALGAAGAVLLLGALGALTYRHVARIPRRILQLGVGVVLATFGTFWAVEGAGGRWPGHEAALVAIGALYLATAAALLRRMRGLPAAADGMPEPPDALPSRVGP
jgi:Ca2+/H+ antiporter, TMEM165/GDT1 family